jgi:hypothetical protein
MLSHYTFNSCMTFTWNNLTDKEWGAVQHLFVKTNLNAYKKCALAIEQTFIEAQTKAFQESFTEPPEIVKQKILNSLYLYLDFNEQKDIRYQHAINENCINKNFIPDLQLKKDYDDLLKLTLLKNYFIAQFQAEKVFLTDKAKAGERLQYLVVYGERLPVAFFSCHVNHDSGGIFLRLTAVADFLLAPEYGQRIFLEIQKQFAGYRALEFCTHKANKMAQAFYELCDFKEVPALDLLTFSHHNHPSANNRIYGSSKAWPTLHPPQNRGKAENEKFVNLIKRL